MFFWLEEKLGLLLIINHIVIYTNFHTPEKICSTYVVIYSKYQLSDALLYSTGFLIIFANFPWLPRERRSLYNHTFRQRNVAMRALH